MCVHEKRWFTSYMMWQRQYTNIFNFINLKNHILLLLSFLLLFAVHSFFLNALTVIICLRWICGACYTAPLLLMKCMFNKKTINEAMRLWKLAHEYQCSPCVYRHTYKWLAVLQHTISYSYDWLAVWVMLFTGSKCKQCCCGDFAGGSCERVEPLKQLPRGLK